MTTMPPDPPSRRPGGANREDRNGIGNDSVRTASPRTTLEAQIHRGFGDVMGNGENVLPWCELCEGYHEEHIKVLQAVTGWNCQRAQKYHREVLSRCLEDRVSDVRSYHVARRRFVRLAPYFRKPKETDPRYLQRMVALKENRPKWDVLLSKDGEEALERHKGLRLRPHLQKKADEIKKKYPITKRRDSRKPKPTPNG